MPISSTMLLILIYMTRPTATRRNHRGVHRDGNYKFMYPLPSPSRAVRKSFRSGRFAFRDLLRPPLPAIGPRSFRVFALFLFYEAFLLSHLLIDRTGTMDSQNAWNGPSRMGNEGSRWIWWRWRGRLFRGFGLSCFTLVKWFTCPWIRNYFVKIRL